MQKETTTTTTTTIITTTTIKQTNKQIEVVSTLEIGFLWPYINQFALFARKGMECK